MYLLVVIVAVALVVETAVCVPVSGNCAVQYQTSLNETMRLKESCPEAEFRDCCQVSETPRLLDSKAAVFGLTEALKAQLQCSSPLAAQIFSLLISLVLQHYDEDCFLPTAGVMRLKIFRCILSLRCNDLYQLGYQDETSLEFTPFFTCRAPDEATPTDHAPTLLDYRSAFNIILACLKKEQEEEVLVPMLRDLVPLLQDRHLTLSAQPDLSMLTTHLCDLTVDHTHQPRPPTVSWFRTDVPLHVYPVLSVLATYPTHMDRSAQEILVLSMDAGLVGRAAMTCVSGLGLAGLELQTTMRRLLPRVLHRLGQITATPTMAVPVLAFLSGLVPTPSLHHSFSVQEYLSVFAIALPYTNHQRYPPYVIALAHRVVSQWFVSCRLQLRPTIASFILKHLSHDPTGGGEGGVGVELVEVCRDMLARYTYSNISALPVRSSGAEFLLNGGPSKTWCVGNSLVTITTSRGNGEQCSRCQSSNQNSDDTTKEPCSCLCRGWAEVSIQRPTGDVSWVMRLQNWLVYDSRRGLYDYGGGSYDEDILTLHRPIEQHHHDSFEVLTEESKLVSSDDDERDVTPVVEDVARDTTPVLEVREEPVPTDSGEQTIGLSLGGREDTERPLQDTKQNEKHIQNAERTETFLDSFNFSPPLEEHSKDSEDCSPENEVNDLSSDKIPLGEISSSPLGEAPVDTEDADSAHVPASWPESVASYSTMTSLEHLPPLLSYDKEEELGRSPPFTQHLPDLDQLKLHADFSQLSSTDEGSTTSSSESGDEVSSWQYKAGPHPRLKHKSLSLPEDSPSSLSTELPPPPPQPTLLTPFTIVTSSPTPQRRKSAPAMPLNISPAQQRKRPLYTHQPQRGGQSGGEESHDPSSVFLQLYHGSMLAQDTPLLLPNNESTERAVKNLHRIHPYETHRIGVVYVAPGQSSETEILANTFGSSRYLEFLRGLGSLLRLPDVPRRLVYLGGLDQSGTDGKVTYCYHDNISQVLFHVATLMPTDLTSDPKCSCKKLHIGNDFVTIVYNDSGSKYKFGTIKGQFNFAEVVVEPRPGGVSLVGVAGRPEIQRLVNSDLVFVSDPWLPQLVRQKALQADLASHVVARTRSSEHYLTNWLGRLRQIRKIREKCSQDNPQTNLFTDYT